VIKVNLKIGISHFFLLLMVIITPKETLHLFADHTDTHCENTQAIQFEKAHIHCDMLAFEVSSFDVIKHTSSVIKENLPLTKKTSQLSQVYLVEKNSVFFRGPPKFIV